MKRPLLKLGLFLCVELELACSKPGNDIGEEPDPDADPMPTPVSSSSTTCCMAPGLADRAIPEPPKGFEFAPNGLEKPAPDILLYVYLLLVTLTSCGLRLLFGRARAEGSSFRSKSLGKEVGADVCLQAYNLLAVA